MFMRIATHFNDVSTGRVYVHSDQNAAGVLLWCSLVNAVCVYRGVAVLLDHDAVCHHH